eukprot:4684584-Ditylum_brightwellii.AAC.1
MIASVVASAEGVSSLCSAMSEEQAGRSAPGATRRWDATRECANSTRRPQPISTADNCSA